MKVIAIFFVLVFCASFVYALEADFDCPSEVFVDEEFECTLVVQNIEAVQDVKIDISPGGKRITKIYSPAEDEWKSAFYYLYGYVGVGDAGVEKTILLKVVEDYEGNVASVLKFRESDDKDKKEFIDFNIKISEGGVGDEESNDGEDDPEEEGDEADEEDKDKKEDKKEEDKPAPRPESKPIIEKIDPKPSVIVLNSPSLEIENEDYGRVVYESKNEKIRKYAPYAFSFFMILLFIVVIFMR